MLRVVGLLALGLVLVVRTSDAVRCPSCLQIDCGPEPECSNGVGWSLCGCCPMCLKGPGEQCGGPWRVYGACLENYTCQLEMEEDFNAEGVCVPSTGGNEFRSKRGLSSPRKAGLSQVQAQRHSHTAHGGIPEHIKAMLRARGVKI